MLPHADYLTKNGYSVLLMDLRSTGESTGTKVYLGAKEWQDVEASYSYLNSLPENKDKKIGYFGISMGAATAIITAGKTQQGDFVIASVPYASLNKLFSFQIVREHLYVPLFLPLTKISASIELGSHYADFDPENLISKIKKPVLIFAAKNDQDVDYKDAEYLYSLANKPKSIWLADASHDIHQEKPDEFSKRVLDFLSNLKSETL
ncbi:alpha/beta hydrolase [Candidatus Gottesmanbacteria bacterium]|nr:alpha/beta hydrolase [Candidatus Gottesmanbacteria bacterium]